MFGSGDNKTDALSKGKIQTIIGEGTEIKGQIQSNGVVRIDGFLEGTISHTGELIIGPKGRLVANVESKAMVIAGEVRGEVNVEGKLELLQGARLLADVRCGHLVVHQGALFHGQSHMAKEETKKGTASAD